MVTSHAAARSGCGVGSERAHNCFSTRCQLVDCAVYLIIELKKEMELIRQYMSSRLTRVLFLPVFLLLPRDRLGGDVVVALD